MLSDKFFQIFDDRLLRCNRGLFINPEGTGASRQARRDGGEFDDDAADVGNARFAGRAGDALYRRDARGQQHEARLVPARQGRGPEVQHDHDAGTRLRHHVRVPSVCGECGGPGALEPVIGAGAHGLDAAQHADGAGAFEPDR